MLRQIRYFQSVVRNNSFSEAAEECNISQSAISQQIKALENELGFPLLERHNRKFVLTPAGEHFYKKSLVLIADLHSGQDRFYLKPAAAVVTARRAGTTTTLDQINRFFLWGHMPIIPSRYWNLVHGQTAEQVLSDTEGIRNLKILAKNMVWFLRCKEAGVNAGVQPPDYD